MMQGSTKACLWPILFALFGAQTIVVHADEPTFREPSSTGSSFFLENDWILHPVGLRQR